MDGFAAENSPVEQMLLKAFGLPFCLLFLGYFLKYPQDKYMAIVFAINNYSENMIDFVFVSVYTIYFPFKCNSHQ